MSDLYGRRSNKLFPPSEIKRNNHNLKVDATAFERERRLKAKRLVQSDDYQYLRDEAARIVETPQLPKDGNSLIAYLSASIRRDSFAELFNRLEFLAAEIPDAIRKTEK